jgi:hypothetical protein
MKNLYLFSLALLFTCITQAQTFQKVYTAGFHQSSKEVLPTGDGGYLIAGMTRTIYAGDTDIYMVKTNAVGDIQWTKQYGGFQPEYANGMVATEDGGFLVIGFTKSYGAGNGDCWLLRLNSSGDLVWSKTYGGTGDDDGKEIIRTSDGNYIFVGRTNYSGGANFDGFLKKVDGSGNEIWTKYYGGSAYETLRSVKQCSDGGFIAIGQTLTFGNAGVGDIYLVRTNSNGDQAWYKTYGGTNEDDGNFVLANGDGSFTFCSETNSFGAGDMDVQATKVDASGNIIWNYYYGGNLKDVSTTIRPTNDGGYIIGAISRSFGWINPDMWLVKIDANGNKTWDKHFGSWYHDHCHSAVPTPDGGFALVGHQVDANDLAHIFIVKTNSEGAVGINELSDDKKPVFNIYPNPSNGLFNILSPSKIQAVNISDALGNKIKTITTDDSMLHIDLSDKPKGAYLVTVQTATSSYTRKIVIR